MRIDAVGDDTVYGKLTHEAQTEVRESPLAVKLSKLAKSISKFGYISAILLVVISFFSERGSCSGLQPTDDSRVFRGFRAGGI